MKVSILVAMGRDTTEGSEAFPEWWPYGNEFPDWHVWRGVNGRPYAKPLRKTSPPIVVMGEDAEDLRDGIRREEARLGWRDGPWS